MREQPNSKWTYQIDYPVAADRLDKLAEHLRQPEFSNYVNLVKIQSNGLRKG